MASSGTEYVYIYFSLKVSLYRACLNYVETLAFTDLVQEGIFRRSGKMTRQQELKNLLMTGCPLQLEDGQFSVHDCASVLKNFLAQLPEPLLTEAHYPAHCQIAGLNFSLNLFPKRVS